MNSVGQVVVVGTPHSRRTVLDAMTLTALQTQTAEVLVAPSKDESKDFIPRPTKKERKRFSKYLKQRALLDASQEVEAVYEQLQNESPFEEEMRSFERFAAPRYSCGHLPSLAACEKECEMKEIAGSTAVPLKPNQPLTTLFTRNNRRI